MRLNAPLPARYAAPRRLILAFSLLAVALAAFALARPAESTGSLADGARAEAPHGDLAPLPNYIVTSLSAATNPSAALGAWQTFSTTNSAIAGDSLSSVAVDSIGNVWAGTTGAGLSTYNGVFWSTIVSPSLANDNVSAVAVDAQDQVWAGSAQAGGASPGIAIRSTANVWTHYLLGLAVTAIAVSGSEVWVGTQGGGVLQFNPEVYPPQLLGVFTAAGTSGGLADDHIHAIAVRYPNTAPFPCTFAPEYWVAHDAGVSVYYLQAVFQNGHFTCQGAWRNYSTTLGDPLPDLPIHALTIDTHQRAWLGSNTQNARGLAVFDSGAWITYTTGNSGLTWNTIRSLGTDKQGRVWIGQRIAPPPGAPPDAPAFPVQISLNVFDDGTWCSYDLNSSSCSGPAAPSQTPSLSIIDIAAGQERIWFATGNVGLASLNLNWHSFDAGNSPMTSNNAQAVWLDGSPSAVWVGELNGADRFDGSAWTHFAFSTAGASQLKGVQALHRDGDGRLWAGETWLDGSSLQHGTLWLNQSNTWQPHPVPGVGGISSLAHDATKNRRLWLGTAGGGAKVFNLGTSSWVSLTTANSPIASNFVNAIERDRAGQMWLGTAAGLSVYTGRDWLTYTTFNTGGGLAGSFIYALAADGLGRMWVGTSTGASMLSGTVWTTYTVANSGLGSNVVTALAVDPADRVWFGTNNGVSVFDGSQWTRFTRANSGLADNSINARAIAADNQGGVWLGAPLGLSVRGVQSAPIGVPTPAIAAFNPGSGPLNAVVTLTGTNFSFGGMESNQVFFTGPNGTLAAAAVLARSGTQALGTLTVRVPFNAVPGPLRVGTTGGIAASAASFTPPPSVTSFTPQAAAAGVLLTVFGANLGGSNARVRFANNVEAFNTLPLASDRLVTRVPPDAASGPLTLVTDGGSAPIGAYNLFQLCALKADSSCAASGDAGALELNQGLPSSRFPLVAGKTTLVRVYVGSAVDGSYAAVDSAKLTISGPGGALTLTAAIPHHTFDNTVRVYAEDYNVNFYLTGGEIPVSGAYNFTVDLYLGTTAIYHASVSKTIVATKDIRFFAVLWGGSATAAELSSLQKAMATISRVYPVRHGVGPLGTSLTRGVRFDIAPGWTPIPSQYYGGSPAGPQVICDLNDSSAGFGYVADVMDDSRIAYNILRSDNNQADRYDNSAGFVPWRLHPGPNNGCAYPSGAAPVNLNGLGPQGAQGEISGAIAAQEVAHNLGLVPPASPSYDGTHHSINETIDDPRAFNLATRMAITEAHTVMEGTCCSGIESNDTQLFEPVDAGPLLTGLRALPGTGTNRPANPAAQPVFNLIGSVSITNVVTRFDSYLSSAASATTPLAPGPYTLAFLDAGNTLLAADGFTPAFADSHGGPVAAGAFRLARPVPAGTTHVQVRLNAGALATYTLSAHAPTLSVISPSGGSFTATQAVSITWSAGDIDGDALTFALAFSRDDGASWQLISAGLTGSSFAWNTALAAGTTLGRIRVTASDGFNTTAAMSARFAVAGKPPVVSITAPQGAARYVEAETITFEGLGTDLQDGLLPPSSLTWASDRDGFLGIGEALTTTLSVGTHRITLTAIDSGARSSSDVVTVTVESDFDGDGIPDSAEGGNFWNPDDAGSTMNGLAKIDRSRGLTHPLTGTAGLLAAPFGVELTAEHGTQSAPATLTIQSTGLSELAWTAAKTEAWLSLGAAGGTTIGTLDLTADAGALAPGIYTDKVLVQAGGFSQTVPVTLTVTSRTAASIYLPAIRR